jgi:hypothetical protein
MFEKLEIELVIKALGSFGKDIAQKMVNNNNLLTELQKQAQQKQDVPAEQKPTYPNGTQYPDGYTVDEPQVDSVVQEQTA